MWKQYRLNDIFTILLVAISVVQNLHFIYDTVTKTWGKKSQWKVFHNQGVSLLLILTVFVIAHCSPTNIIRTPVLYYILVSLGAIFSKITLHIQIAHLGNEEKEY